MKVLLIGGPLDGQYVEVTPAAANVISSQNHDNYVRALPGVFISAQTPPDEIMAFIANKIAESYTLRQRVGMALAQLDDAAMYSGPQLPHVNKARAILR